MSTNSKNLVTNVPLSRNATAPTCRSSLPPEPLTPSLDILMLEFESVVNTGDESYNMAIKVTLFQVNLVILLRLVTCGVRKKETSLALETLSASHLQHYIYSNLLGYLFDFLLNTDMPII
ncbi:hypothetical protein AVEN_127853-1 [Araneus ventricosus]|uniref:Uncharacterized protein n=1 Tax=Araneus ventricosus TaxID=182803 RepID=A0A4Y1ZZU1_ARAVE|nr:hypothetical protein AVEN_127853-1 [Araneus ventricosus]